MNNTKRIATIVSLLIMTLAVFATRNKLPIKPPESEGYKEIGEGIHTRWSRGIRNLYTPKLIFDSISGTREGLKINLNKITRLLDGRQIDPRYIYGKVYYGPYPFESMETVYHYKRFRRYSRFVPKTASANIDIDYLIEPSHNSENWKDRGQLMLRIVLKYQTEEEDLSLGVYDLPVRFAKKNGMYVKLNTVTEGPFVNLIHSHTPGKLTVSFKTSDKCIASVQIKDHRVFKSKKHSGKHEIQISGLKADSVYKYRIRFDSYQSRYYKFKTAPAAGMGRVIFAYSGDSREGTGGLETNLMGINAKTAERNANIAFQKKADLFIFGGDLMNGNTTSIPDYRTQIFAWKQAFSGYWRHRPVYACMGNHESLLRNYENADGEILKLDRWPYSTDSAEAVFADELVHPQNAPKRDDERRPSYSENVYSFQYGPVKFIAFNNNYWISKSKDPLWEIPVRFGGCPEGYLMPDQLGWIERELKNAEKDPTVKYIILFAQEPVFPNGGHVEDCMWYHGNNKVRATTYDPANKRIIPEKEGIIEVRNRLVSMAGKYKKVAAVLGSDEHSYHKTLIDHRVPVGVPEKDDREGYGLVCLDDNSCSAIQSLNYPTWYIVSGGSGAPYYAEEDTPWNRYWKAHPYRYRFSEHQSKRGCYHYSSQENLLIFEADQDRISVSVYNPYGELIDDIRNLMAVKKKSTRK